MIEHSHLIMFCVNSLLFTVYSLEGLSWQSYSGPERTANRPHGDASVFHLAVSSPVSLTCCIHSSFLDGKQRKVKLHTQNLYLYFIHFTLPTLYCNCCTTISLWINEVLLSYEEPLQTYTSCDKTVCKAYNTLCPFTLSSLYPKKEGFDRHRCLPSWEGLI